MSRALNEIDTLVFINNALSCRLVEQELLSRGIDGQRVALFLLRHLEADWFKHCASLVDYGRPVAHSRLGQMRVSGFYIRAAWRLRRLLARNRIRHIYLVNNDNLLTNHVLGWARVWGIQCEVVVVVEGLMNFQDITLRNRQSWRTRAKEWIAPLLGLSWTRPAGHLSGAFDARVDRVLTFGRHGLKAPNAKVHEQPLTPLSPPQRIESRTVLIVLSGIWQWLSATHDETLSRGFVTWLVSEKFDRILVKRHPHVAAGAIERLLPKHERVESRLGLEELAGEITAGTVAGICCTALVTLKLLRPDVRCVDYGTDYYCRHAYFGDESVKEVMKAAGVTLIQLPEPSNSHGVT